MVRVSTAAAAAGVEGGIEVELQLIHKHFFFSPFFPFMGRVKILICFFQLNVACLSGQGR